MVIKSEILLKFVLIVNNNAYETPVLIFTGNILIQCVQSLHVILLEYLLDRHGFLCFAYVVEWHLGTVEYSQNVWRTFLAGVLFVQGFSADVIGRGLRLGLCTLKNASCLLLDRHHWERSLLGAIIDIQSLYQN